jgi:hypothetical protein
MTDLANKVDKVQLDFRQQLRYEQRRHMTKTLFEENRSAARVRQRENKMNDNQSRS